MRPPKTFLISLLFFAFLSAPAFAAPQSFQNWVEHFKPRALARGIPENLYVQVMRPLSPDMSVIKADREQPEIKEETWAYLNRRVSDWRVRAGRERYNQNIALFERIEKAYGVDPVLIAAVWGMESGYGDLNDNPKYMKPVLASLATLAWAEPRRRKYWEQELLNALTIVARGWAKPDEMLGSWAGAMGHTQWMPEVWLHVGLDFNGDGKVSPFGPPDDALAGVAHYLAARSNYQQGMPWGYEVKATPQFNFRLADNRTSRLLSEWEARGLTRADGKPFDHKNIPARVVFPAGANGPGFALTQNFFAVMSYNPSFKYALAVCLLSDRLKGGQGLVTPWPGAERQLSLEEMIELQQRLTALGFDTEGADGRVGLTTMKAVQAYQKKRGLNPADGTPSERVLAALRGEKS
jgi:membrane-bound lytic murein transglycosylase B